MLDDDWERLLLMLAGLGVRVSWASRATGTVLVQVPLLDDERGD